MSKRIDVKPGDRFGKIVCITELDSVKGMRRWSMQCDCGSVFDALQKSFTSGGKMASCGCARYENYKSHGMSESKEYRAWVNMKTRCYDSRIPNYDRWGGRGIKVCDRWVNSFEAFYSDIGPAPDGNSSVDRIDNNGDYEPGNCRWATQQEQMRNTSTNRLVVIGGRRMPLSEAAEKAPVKYNTVIYRLKRGWSLDDALSLPPQKRTKT